jgi:putative transcriptional regulator
MRKKYQREPIPADLHCNVRRVRESVGWELSDLAEKIGTTAQTLRRLEAEKHAPSLPVALRISAILDVSVDDLWCVPSYGALRPSSTSTSAIVDLGPRKDIQNETE